jgi:serine/threonine protein kinase
MAAGVKEYVSGSSHADPVRVADVALSAAVRAQADAVYIEPLPMSSDSYVLTIERGATVLATVPLEAGLGTAVIARLAFIADLDLAAAHASSAVVPVRAGNREADVVVTVRPGPELRADLMIARQRGKGTQALDAPAIGPSPDDIIGQYKVIEFLGEGGMGTVYSVEHVALGRQYALKVLRTRVIDRDSTAAQRFLREARTAARIRHPNIVDVFDFGHLPDGRPYFVMELLEGESLGDRVSRGPLLPAEVVSIARQLGEALAAAHDRGVIHADVTPSNVLVVNTEDGGQNVHVKLVDFGLAELAGESMSDDTPEFVLGTPAYISPEQLRGLSPTDRSDQYGLGAVLFEMLTGHPPYEHEDLRKLCMMHIQAPIPLVESPHGPIPPKLADLVTTCLQKTPQARFPGIRALLAALDEIERVTDRRGWRRWLSS